MHFVKDATYVSGYELLLTFEDGSVKRVDLSPDFLYEIGVLVTEAASVR